MPDATLEDDDASVIAAAVGDIARVDWTEGAVRILWKMGGWSSFRS